MKNFAVKHPVITGLLVFLATIIGGFIFIIIGATLLSGDCKPINGDPCDGGGLIIAGLITLITPVSLFIGVFGGLLIFGLLSSKREEQEKLK
jgi:hypothetical protein